MSGYQQSFGGGESKGSPYSSLPSPPPSPYSPLPPNPYGAPLPHPGSSANYHNRAPVSHTNPAANLYHNPQPQPPPGWRWQQAGGGVVMTPNWGMFHPLARHLPEDMSTSSYGRPPDVEAPRGPFVMDGGLDQKREARVEMDVQRTVQS